MYPLKYLKEDISSLLLVLYFCHFNKSAISIFANNMKLFSAISFLPNFISLKNDFNSLVSWANRLNTYLSLNIYKCRTMSYYRTKSKITFPYLINDIIVQSASDSMVVLAFIYSNITCVLDYILVQFVIKL